MCPVSGVHSTYDRARTPYQRLLEAGVLTEAKRQELAATYHGLNPVLLLRRINESLEHLWALAERPMLQPKAGARSNSVTVISEATMPVR